MTGPLVTIGRVRSVTPGHRQIRVAPVSGTERYCAGLEWVFVTLRDPGEDWPDTVRCRVAGLIDEPGQLAITFTAGVARDMVARMKGAEVKVESKDEGIAGDDPSRWAGYAVRDASGAPFGTVASVEYTGAQHVLEIRRNAGGAILAPAVDAVVAAVDAENRVLTLGDITPHAIEYDPVSEEDDGGAD